MNMTALKKRLSALRADQSGSAAIELALVAPIFAVGIASLVTLNGAADRAASMNDALSTSAQVIVNGSKDLGHLETLFGRNYGRTPAGFSTAMVCACAPQYSSDDSGDGSGPVVMTADFENRSARYENAQVNGEWMQCENSCAQSAAPIQFLEMSVRDAAPKPIFGEAVTLEAKLMVRVIESLEK